MRVRVTWERFGPLTVAGIKLEDVNAAFVGVGENSTGQVYGDSMLGLPFFRHFLVTFDYMNDQLILIPKQTNK